MNLIAGLGNPEPKHKNTRHNIGFLVIDLLSEKLGVRLTDKRFQSRNAKISYKGKDIVLLCPSTYMNLSGKSIKACTAFYHVHSEDALIIHDDLDMPVGRIKVMRHGSAGGHKGVQSIIDHMGTTHFSRIKMGIGRPLFGETIEDYVLSPFYKDQQDKVIRMIRLAVLACQLFVLTGVESVMSQVNQKKRR